MSRERARFFEVRAAAAVSECIGSSCAPRSHADGSGGRAARFPN